MPFFFIIEEMIISKDIFVYNFFCLGTSFAKLFHNVCICILLFYWILLVPLITFQLSPFKSLNLLKVHLYYYYIKVSFFCNIFFYTLDFYTICVFIFHCYSLVAFLNFELIVNCKMLNIYHKFKNNIYILNYFYIIYNMSNVFNIIIKHGIFHHLNNFYIIIYCINMKRITRIN